MPPRTQRGNIVTERSMRRDRERDGARSAAEMSEERRREIGEKERDDTAERRE